VFLFGFIISGGGWLVDVYVSEVDEGLIIVSSIVVMLFYVIENWKWFSCLSNVVGLFFSSVYECIVLRS